MNFKKAIVIAVSILLAGCASQQSLYKKAVETNTIEKYEDFLQKYPDSEYQSSVKDKIIDIEFSNTKAKNTIIALEAFLKKYPDNKYKEQATEQIEALEFKDVRQSNSIKSIQHFLEKYPNSKYKNEAELYIVQLEFDEAKNTNTVSAFEKFILNNPNSGLIKDAKTNIKRLEFDEVVKSGSVDKYLDFFSKYDAQEYLQKIPDNTLRKEIETQLSLINILQAEDEIALSNFVAFLKDNPKSISKYNKAVKITLDGIVDKIKGNITQEMINNMMYLDEFFIKKNNSIYEKIAAYEIEFVMIVKYMETKVRSFPFLDLTLKHYDKPTNKVKGVKIGELNKIFNELENSSDHDGRHRAFKKLNSVKSEILYKILNELEGSANQEDRLREWQALENILSIIDLKKLAFKEGQPIFDHTLTDLIQDIDVPFSDIQKRLTKYRNKDKNKENLEISSKIISNLKEIKYKVDNEGKIAEFIYEACKGNTERLNSYLKKGMNINVQNEDGETALMSACSFNNIENIKFLLKNGSNVQMKDNKGKTALFHACRAGYGRIVGFKIDNYIPSINLLLDAGSDINEQDTSGKTVLMFSTYSGYADLVEFIINKNPKINIQTNNGESALILLLGSNHGSNEEKQKILKLLIKSGADVNLADNNSKTPLMYAVDTYNYNGLVEPLLEKGADPNAKDNKGKSVLSYAKNSKSILVKYGAK